MKKLLRKLIILIIVVCIFLLIQKNTTRLGTTTQTGDVQTGTVTTSIDLSGCISYFDGCNNCSVKDGKPDACTLMYCETPSEPKCLQYMTGVSTGMETNYSVKDGTLYFHSKPLYENVFKKCLGGGGLFFQAADIILETKDYLLFNVKAGPCESERVMGTMLLRKSDNVSNMMSLGDKLYSYVEIDGDILYIDQYNGRTLSQGGAIEPKGFYEKYDCPECGIILDRTLQININDLSKYITGSVGFPTLTP